MNSRYANCHFTGLHCIARCAAITVPYQYMDCDGPVDLAKVDAPVSRGESQSITVRVGCPSIQPSEETDHASERSDAGTGRFPAPSPGSTEPASYEGSNQTHTALLGDGVEDLKVWSRRSSRLSGIGRRIERRRGAAANMQDQLAWMWEIRVAVGELACGMFDLLGSV